MNQPMLASPTSRRSMQRGLSLIELMISMVIGLILMAGVISIMLSSKRAYNIQTDLAHLQENSRFAMQYLVSDLRMAGYFGCNSNSLSDTLAVEGEDATGENDSDVVRIAFLETNESAFAIMHCPSYDKISYSVTKANYDAECPENSSSSYPGDTPLTVGTQTFTLSNVNFSIDGELEEGDTLVATDCGSSERYTVQSLTKSGAKTATVKLTKALSRDYDNAGYSYGSELRRLLEYRYFIGEIKTTDSTGREVISYALCRDTQALSAAKRCDPDSAPDDAEALVEGVENLQIRYGMQNGLETTLQYLKASDVTDWNSVISIRLTLLLRTEPERFDQDLDEKTYDLDPDMTDYNPTDDHRLRKIFTNTVMLRNQ